MNWIFNLTKSVIFRLKGRGYDCLVNYTCIIINIRELMCHVSKSIDREFTDGATKRLVLSKRKMKQNVSSCPKLCWLRSEVKEDGGDQRTQWLRLF